MRLKHNRAAILYDFDGTLTPKYMHDYDFFPELKIDADSFWQEVRAKAREMDGDQTLAYMYLMVKYAREKAGVQLTENRFREFGRKVEFFPGVEGWFDRMNQFADSIGLVLEHYIVSSGVKEMIEGTTIADKFKRIYACAFHYDPDTGLADWPILNVNYTTKTQYIYRISKGVLNNWDGAGLNRRMAAGEEFAVPIRNMLYLGDGETDVPGMKAVRQYDGHAVAVYDHENINKVQESQKLVQDDRVDAAKHADYSEESLLDEYVKAVLREIQAHEVKLALE
ncbi:haloacid dehalogenase-like hydrolase [bacterium]|nr:haloacid dehalogenase-like hydrolase [bacterium]